MMGVCNDGMSGIGHGGCSDGMSGIGQGGVMMGCLI